MFAQRAQNQIRLARRSLWRRRAAKDTESAQRTEKRGGWVESDKLHRRLDTGWRQLACVALENSFPFVDHFLQLSCHLKGVVAVHSAME